ncbi:MAG: cation diffusion facilitator family transporter [Phycisphaerales bacterium]|nr:cation diffusion facilitator family transporter [Phycisphaerales bacterium]
MRDQTQTPSEQSNRAEAQGQRLALIGAVVNILLAAVKLVAGLVGNSYALVADAIESFADILGSVVIWSGLRIASRPTDRRHPYGYGKAESLAALVVALMILGAGIAIMIEAIREIVTPHHAPAPFTLGVLVAVVVVKEVMFRVVRRAAATTQSSALHTDSWHHRADALTSAAAFVGITVALIGGPGYEPADDWAALLASGVILYNAVKLMVAPVRELLDAQAVDIGNRACAIATDVTGIENVQKAAARKAGSGYWVDMHARVRPDMSVRDAHALAHRVKDRIREQMPEVRDVLIHIEPAAEVGGARNDP